MSRESFRFRLFLPRLGFARDFVQRSLLINERIFMTIEHLFLLVLYGLLSLITFCVYGLDKWAAKRQKSRVMESRLHLLSLIGGWPGALLGQKVFRHKTKKVRFRVVFWLTLVANVTLVSLVFLLLNGWV